MGTRVRRYLAAFDRGEMPAPEQSRRAFETVRDRFDGKVREAMARGETFEGYGFDEIHHRN